MHSAVSLSLSLSVASKMKLYIYIYIYIQISLLAYKCLKLLHDPSVRSSIIIYDPMNFSFLVKGEVK